MSGWTPPSRYRPPEKTKKAARKAQPGERRSRVTFLFALLLLVAAAAFTWYKWIGPQRQAELQERMRPPGKVSILPAAPVPSP